MLVFSSWGIREASRRRWKWGEGLASGRSPVKPQGDFFFFFFGLTSLLLTLDRSKNCSYSWRKPRRRSTNFKNKYVLRAALMVGRKGRGLSGTSPFGILENCPSSIHPSIRLLTQLELCTK